MIEANISPEVAAALTDVIGLLAPPPNLTVSQWADKFRVLREGTPVPGPWRTDLVPYLREIMDFINDPEVQEGIFMKSSQVAATEGGLNIVGYLVHYDPCDMLGIFPSGKGGDADRWSKRRFQKMVDACPALQEVVCPEKSKFANNTIEQKIFRGGGLELVGANSPSKLASTPCRFVFFEEITSISQSCGPQGDTIGIAEARTTSFPNRKMYKSGSPSVTGVCLSEREFLRGDQRYWFVPCFDCGEGQRLIFEQIVWDKDEDGEAILESARYQCKYCGAKWTDIDLNRATRKGHYRPTAPFKNGVRSWHVWQIYSPFVRIAEIVAKFLKAKGNADTLQVFYNTVLGLTWDDTGERIQAEDLEGRSSNYGIDPIPKEVCLITVGCDVQMDRIEMEVCGWSTKERTYSLEYIIIQGDPKDPATWEAVDTALLKKYNHPSGVKLKISAAAIDSGYSTDEVYAFCKNRLVRGVFPIKGYGLPGIPLLRHPQRHSKRKQKRAVRLWIVGTNTAKDTVSARLRVVNPDKFGYMAIPDRYPDTWRIQVTSERRIPKMVNGRLSHKWFLPKGKRNEALDCRVYNLAAREFLGYSNEHMNRLYQRLQDGKDVAVTKKATVTRRVRSKGISI